MKKNIFFLWILFFMLVFSTKGFALDKQLENHIFIVVNDQLISFSGVYPLIKEGITYVPARFFSDYIEADLQWDADKQIIILKKENKSITIDMETKSLATDAGHIIADAVFLKDSVMMIPYSFVARYFDYEVSYISQGPIARAQNLKSSLNDQIIYDIIKEEIIIEQNKMIEEIERKAKEENQRRYKERLRNSKVAYITFDDGPSIYTEQILNILSQYDSKATFFMLSNRIKSYPYMVNMIVNQGHSAGLHGVTHDINKMYRSSKTLLSEMNECNDSLQSVVGFRSDIIRVPYGSKPYMPAKYKDVLMKEGYKLWDWNVDGNDSIKPNTQSKEIIDIVKKQVSKTKLPVILLHERQATVKALPYILDYLKQENYILIPINEGAKPVNWWQYEK